MNYLQEHIELCRSYIDEINEGESDWTDDEIVRYIDAENQHLSALVREKNEDFFGYRHIFPVTSNQNEYWMPRTTGQLVMVEMITSGVSGSAPDFVVDEMNREYYVLDRSDSIKDLYRPTTTRRYLSARWRVSDESYRLYDNKIIFWPGTGLEGHIRLWFIRVLPKLHYGSAAAATENSITLAAVPTKGRLMKEHDIYTGMLIGIYSGLGDSQVRRIQNYDATTRVATIDEPWLVNPDTSSVYSLISPIPDQLQEMLPIGAALRASNKKKDDTTRWMNLYEGMKQDFLNDINPRDRTQTRRVRRS